MVGLNQRLLSPCNEAQAHGHDNNSPPNVLFKADYSPLSKQKATSKSVEAEKIVPGSPMSQFFAYLKTERLHELRDHSSLEEVLSGEYNNNDEYDLSIAETEKSIQLSIDLVSDACTINRKVANHKKLKLNPKSHKTNNTSLSRWESNCSFLATPKKNTKVLRGTSPGCRYRTSFDSIPTLPLRHKGGCVSKSSTAVTTGTIAGLTATVSPSRNATWDIQPRLTSTCTGPTTLMPRTRDAILAASLLVSNLDDPMNIDLAPKQPQRR